MPVMNHTGTSVFPAPATVRRPHGGGRRGGRFPDLPYPRHAGVSLHGHCMFLARPAPHVTSTFGHPPKRLPPVPARLDSIADKVLWGPRLAPIRGDQPGKTWRISSPRPASEKRRISAQFVSDLRLKE